MKKQGFLKHGFVVLLLFLLLSVGGGAAVQDSVSEQVDVQKFLLHSPYVSVSAEDSDEFLVRFEVSDLLFTTVLIEDQQYVQVSLPSESQVYSEGAPELPMIARSILVPRGFQVQVDIVDAQFDEYAGVRVAPSKGDVPRSVSFKTVPFVFNDIYEVDGWFPDRVVSLDQLYRLRDVQGQVVQFYPCQYQPVEHRLRVYSNVTVRISFVAEIPGAPVRDFGVAGSIDREFYQVYQRRFLNVPFVEVYDPVLEDGGLLIITYDDFSEAMQPFVSWKIKRGVPTWMVNVSEAPSPNEIKNLIQSYYENEQISFVLLVGDAQQVPTLHTGHGYASDPMYTYLVGDDHYPDVFIGRFSAQTLEDLETQIYRTLTYEQTPDPDGSWYHQATGIASDESGDGGDDNESDFEHIRNIRDDLLNFTYSGVDELYDGTNGGLDDPGNPTPGDVAAAINDGRSLVTYCGHGNSMVWGTSGFANSDVNDLTNTNMLPFIWSVACWNGEFEDYNTCFAEAWVRATHNGEPTGAIATFMASSGQSWNPPMAAQDEMVDLLVESYQNFTPRTFGGLSYSGCMLMNDEYGYSGYATTDTWHVFGDPTLLVRTDTPINLTVNHESFINATATNFTVQVIGVDDALCTLSYQGTILGKAVTDPSGTAVIELLEPLPDRGALEFVVIGFNALSYLTTVQIDADNTAPNTPTRPQGQRIILKNRPYHFRTSATDPDDDLLYYQWDWGDDTMSDWVGPWPSGEIGTAAHEWNESGLMLIRVRAKDMYDEISDWSAPLRIPVAAPFLQEHSFLLQLFERFFPRLFQMYSSLTGY